LASSFSSSHTYSDAVRKLLALSNPTPPVGPTQGFNRARDRNLAAANDVPPASPASFQVRAIAELLAAPVMGSTMCYN
jgi:hypothetical protein